MIDYVSIAGLIYGFASGFFNEFITIVLHFFGVYYYFVTNASLFYLIINQLPARNFTIRNGESEGWIYGWPYIGHVSRSSENVWLYTTKSFYDKLISSSTEEEKEEEEIKKSDLHVIFRHGTYASTSWQRRTLKIFNFIAREDQSAIINKIVNNFEKKQAATAYIWGKPGSGKSMVPLLIAQQLGGRYCNTYDFTDPNNMFDELYYSAAASEKKPLIVVLEEFDILIGRIHRGEIQRHRKSRIDVKTKCEFNSFMDRISLGIYPFLILIFTSNVSPMDINKMDASYLRPGRVDGTYLLKTTY